LCHHSTTWLWAAVTGGDWRHAPTFRQIENPSWRVHTLYKRYLRAAPAALFTTLIDYATTSLLPLHNLLGPTVPVAPVMRFRTVHQ
jgi:hypothetical protein